MEINKRLQETIRTVPDFPKPGIMFKDITPVLEDPILSGAIIQEFRERLQGVKIDAIAGVESRGFLFGMALSIAMGVPFLTIRKKGKLPAETISHAYALEYGEAEIEIHKGSVKSGWNVLIHDDLLATGGTAKAAAELIIQMGAEVAAFAFVIELGGLKGRETLQPFGKKLVTLVSF